MMKWSMMLKRLFSSLILILLAISLIVSCSGGDFTQTITETQTQTGEATATLYTSSTQNETTTTAETTTTTTTTETSPSTTTTATTTKTQIPGGFTTYTSAGLFGISYPSDWELLNYMLEDIEAISQDVLSNIDSGLPLSQASYIFLAGLPTDLGWEPSINIVVESLPFPVSSLDEAVDAEIIGLQSVVDTYIEISRTNVEIGDREATLLYWEGIIGLDSVSNLQMIMLLDNVVWIITCTPPPGEYYAWEDDFYNITNSFRYLK